MVTHNHKTLVSKIMQLNTTHGQKYQENAVNAIPRLTLQIAFRN